MTDYSQDFGPFENKIWLNTAHQGALPRVAIEQAHEAIAWKIAPYNLTTDRFSALHRISTTRKRKNNSLPLCAHTGSIPPSVETCHLPCRPGNDCT